MGKSETIVPVEVYEFKATAVDGQPNVWKISASFESAQISMDSIYLRVNKTNSLNEESTTGTSMTWTEVKPLEERPVEKSIGYYESKGILTSSVEPAFSSVEVDGKGIILQNAVISASKISEGTWEVSYKGDTTQEYLGKVSAIFKLDGGASKNGFGLTFVSSSSNTGYTFKDASEAKVFIKEVNNTARQILADVNALESSKLRQERLLDSADRLYDSYESRIIKLQERMDAILAVRDERVANLLLAFEAEVIKSEELSAKIVEAKTKSDFSNKAVAIENLDAKLSEAIPPVIKTNFEKVRLSEREAAVIVKKDVEVEKAEIISKLKGEQIGSDLIAKDLSK
jgi:hypothetical protein